MPLLKQRIPIIPLVLGLGVILTAVLFAATRVPAAPPISWNPTEVVETIAQGETKTTIVSFTSGKDLANVVVWVVPELQLYVSTDPSSFPSIGKGDMVTLTLTLSAPPDAPLETFEGTIHLRDGSGKSNKTYAKPLPVTLTITVVPLPPDPGEAGKATLEGIDSDGDGVRDDIQRYIALTYPESEKTRASATQMAKAMQELILDADNKEASIMHGRESSHAVDCLSYIHGIGSDDTWDIIYELRAQVLNTDARSRAYLLADEHLGGQRYPSLPLEERKQHCDFDPDAMEN